MYFSCLPSRFVPMFGVSRGFYYSIFQAISSFCNSASTSLVEGNRHAAFSKRSGYLYCNHKRDVAGRNWFYVLLTCTGSFATNATVSSCIRKWFYALACFLLPPALFCFSSLSTTIPKRSGVGMSPYRTKRRGLYFHSVSSRTAGFAAVPQSDLTPASKILTVIYMFIGASLPERAAESKPLPSR